ncbi:hypothetical protein CONLIGDRAFT_645795 [Coniochaeta ligniaria NRRL 30616]|uniref:Uncharacterized protein n=1 Tax=Coniochaeta ligniaria NRRL 30616 TaxID=1408157 RepID=A0A1J7IJT0_9PEZI|nr:hypothetical protein CONLIGDRAFT_645795 [Coniochaeta ligniaria NRRL 30616]
MASYSIFPRPEQPSADQSAAARAAHSRFVEGSMNDRVSNAPPPTFLGPEEMAAYERQFYADSNHSRSRPTSGSDQSFNRTSGSKFWDGIRDKFTRTKSSSSITTLSSNKSRSSIRFSQHSQQNQVAPGAPNEKENVSGYYPSREEVMENYRSLVDAGFFSSHAIQGTRHQPPPQRSGVTTDHPLPAPPPPPVRDAPPAPFSQLVTQKQRKLQHQSQDQANPATPALSSIFASIPYSATQPSPTGDAPLTTYARPDPRPPISLPKKYRRQRPTTYQAAPPPPTSPLRGTKRAVADMTGGSVDRETANASSNNTDNTAEAGARKLVKKLRKSASRISADLSLRPATSTGNGGVSNHPYGSSAAGGSTKNVSARGAATSSTSVDLEPRPPMSSAGRAMGVVRSLSSSFKRDGGKPAAAVPSDHAATPVPLPTTTPNKLLKAKRSISRRVSLGRSRSGSTSSPIPPVPSHLPPPVPPHRTQQAPVIVPFSDPEPTPRPSTTSAPAYDGGDPMALDPPPSPPTRNPSLDVQPGGLSVPSFHYPQRQKILPLAAAPDPNRGVPGVPAAMPAQFGGRRVVGHVKSGSFCFGTPAGFGAGDGLGGRDLALGGMRDVEKENYGVY